jgi:hypothetical protein
MQKDGYEVHCFTVLNNLYVETLGDVRMNLHWGELRLGEYRRSKYLLYIEIQLVCNGVGVRNRHLLRNQLHWPRLGKDIHIREKCWTISQG